MKTPKHLGHKPLISVNNYHNIDGQYSKHTDAMALSIGHAQYDENEISLKVWRHTKDRWSRQSEELPLHRNLDLTILLAQVLFGEEPNPDSFLVKQQTLLTEDVVDGLKIVKAYYKNHEKFLKPRFKELRDLLNKME